MAGGRGGGGPLLHLQENQPADLRNRGKDAALCTAAFVTRKQRLLLHYCSPQGLPVACIHHQGNC